MKNNHVTSLGINWLKKWKQIRMIDKNPPVKYDKNASAWTPLDRVRVNLRIFNIVNQKELLVICQLFHIRLNYSYARNHLGQFTNVSPFSEWKACQFKYFEARFTLKTSQRLDSKANHESFTCASPYWAAQIKVMSTKLLMSIPFLR